MFLMCIYVYNIIEFPEIQEIREVLSNIVDLYNIIYISINTLV